MTEPKDLPLVRVTLKLDEGEWHGNATERLWAERVSRGRYRLRNSPFFAFGISSEDVVFGEMRDDEVYFAGVSLRGGHSTYRLILDKDLSVDSASFRKFWAPLGDLGCSFEEGLVLAVDVPPSTNPARDGAHDERVSGPVTV